MPWNDERPMSPHLQVYKLPLTAKLSVLHRGTGAILFFGFILLSILLVLAMSGAESWSYAQAFLSSWLGYLALLGFSFSLYYHLCNGIRHLLWDIGYGFSLEQTQKSGLYVIAAAIGLTVLTWLVALVGGVA
jgi:succinate dehydrogenase / fumarate reductase cytochrome b subunit